MGKKYYIRVPKDEKAMDDYDHGMQKKEQMEEMIMSEEQFYTLWNMGVFDMINIECDALIDDYEEEYLALDKIPKAIEIVNRIISTNSNEKLIELREMLKLAMEYKTLVGFDF